KVRETRVLTVYMIIGCVILLGTAFILPRHRAVGRRPVLPD
ncbi:fucose permease, partial [Bifidobacterium longum]